MKGNDVDISLEKWENKIVISIKGKLMLPDVSFVRKELTRMIEENDKNVEIHLTGLQHVDSAGIGLLLQAHKKVQAAGKDISFSGLGAEVQKIFAMAGLLEILNIQAR
ncbi:MAG: STAS domain-containing protein [Spirochaetales bacterium]|nr:STAS domain-containing protein [Spirochaetales bacterium]